MDKSKSRRSNSYIQGGAVNHGLFFAGPLLQRLGAVSGKISETDGRQSKQ
jgi:hypothetical protein